MAAISTIIAGVGLGIAAAGAGVQAYGTFQAAAASRRAEDLRKKQMNLDAGRKRREVIRQMQIAQAGARSNAATQGASQGDSAVQGALSQQANTAGQNLSNIHQSQQIGSNIFSANADYAQGQATASWGSAFQSVGMGLAQNSGMISRVGSSAGLWAPDVA
jgi:hypothetical protein